MENLINNTNMEKEGRIAGKNLEKVLFEIMAFILLFIFLSLFISAVDSSVNSTSLSIAPVGRNATLEAKATACIQESEAIRDKLRADGFNVQRVEDSISQAKILYEAQVAKKPYRKDDFSVVLPYCDEINTIDSLAYSSVDQLNALRNFYNKSISPGMNTSDVDALVNAVADDISGERYEQVEEHANKAFDAITNLQASYSFINVTTRGIKEFIIRNFLNILLLFLAIFLPSVVFKKQIRTYFINRSLEKLEVRKKTLKNLIKNTQRDYFQYGKIPEGAYNIKTKKFAEMVRDIDRQIPLLKEELAKLRKKPSSFNQININVKHGKISKKNKK